MNTCKPDIASRPPRTGRWMRLPGKASPTGLERLPSRLRKCCLMVTSVFLCQRPSCFSVRKIFSPHSSPRSRKDRERALQDAVSASDPTFLSVTKPRYKAVDREETAGEEERGPSRELRLGCPTDRAPPPALRSLINPHSLLQKLVKQGFHQSSAVTGTRPVLSRMAMDCEWGPALCPAR